MSDALHVRRALLSVSDKSGLADLARTLHDLGVELISTGGTAKAIAAVGLPVTPVEAVTGFPEMMDGRVKTLHPKIHGGLLALRDDPEHARALRDHAIAPIDLVCINLYPFEQTIARAGVTRHDAIENIDIGGPSMVRSAAKNADWVVVLTDPADYAPVIAELRAARGHTSLATRRRLQAKAFARTAAYDSAIAAWLAQQGEAGENASARASAPAAAATPSSPLPTTLNIRATLKQALRYGENPHQHAALYELPAPAHHGPSIARATQLHGKELSYNNLNDGAAALALAAALADLAASDSSGGDSSGGDASGGDASASGSSAFPPIAACVIKHANPCGAALAFSALDAVDEAIAGDPIAAYGGIVALSAPVDAACAARLAAKDAFFEVVLAPSFTDDALATLRARSQNVRLLATGPLRSVPSASPAPADLEFRSIPGAILAQTPDRAVAPALTHAAGPECPPDLLPVARFLEPVCRALTSNAVCIGGLSPTRTAPGAHALRLFGAGAGQMDRVTSSRLATEKAGPLARGGVAFSDAFFPFDDGPRLLVDAGVRVIVHPGGSKRDADTFALCTQRGVTCLLNGLRHFRH